MRKTEKIWKKKIKPMEVTCENEISDSNSLKPFETLEILTVEAVIMRKKVQKQSSGSVLQLVL